MNQSSINQSTNQSIDLSPALAGSFRAEVPSPQVVVCPPILWCLRTAGSHQEGWLLLVVVLLLLLVIFCYCCWMLVLLLLSILCLLLILLFSLSTVAAVSLIAVLWVFCCRCCCCGSSCCCCWGCYVDVIYAVMVLEWKEHLLNTFVFV